MDTLPYELSALICSYLDPLSCTRIQQTCKRYLYAGRDSNTWFSRSFDKSLFSRILFARRSFRVETTTEQQDSSALCPIPRAQQLANWDPGYPEDDLPIHWYTEYIHREAPISVNWLQQPRDVSAGDIREPLEVRGLSVFNPSTDRNKSFAFAPLDDGTVCLWDLFGSMGRKGSIVARSASNVKPGITTNGIVECVSVDDREGIAYVAVGNDVAQIDIKTMATISRQRFSHTIGALSVISGDQITVSTGGAIHLFDPRDRRLASIDARPYPADFDITLDFTATRPGPQSILHLDNSDATTSEIYLCGRFPSILVYDRRTIGKLKDTIHSGARLCSMTATKHSFNHVQRELSRDGKLSVEEAHRSKSIPGHTIIACGEYKSKGSLELYGIAPNRSVASPDSTYKNRQTISSSKILSVAQHGTRLVCTDGGGNITWLEKDGTTRVRDWNLASTTTSPHTSTRDIFGNLGDNYMESQAGDIVRKVLPSPALRYDASVNKDNLLLWTGEKIGLLGFSTKRMFSQDEFEDMVLNEEDLRKETQERTYAQTMRRALEQQANEARYVRGLGMDFFS